MSTPGGLAIFLSETQGADTTRYLHGPRGIFARKDADNNWEWMMQDGLGSVRGVVSHANAVLESRQYDPIGNTVIVIEHNLAVIKNADWIIDMGPEGGNKGGRVMFEGTPQQLLGASHSLTSAYLKN